jgi:F-type H+-transporting ATPase subunit a
MDKIGGRLVWYYVPFTDTLFPLGGINVLTVRNTLLVIALLRSLLRLATRNRAWVTGRAQMAEKVLVHTFDDQVASALSSQPREMQRFFLPMILCLFMYILFCNALPIIPGLHIEEPTTNLNCTLSMRLMSITVCVASGLRAQGTKGYLMEMLGPLWHKHGIKGPADFIGCFSAVLFAPLHTVNQGSRAMSLSLRLFGNIMGASIIMLVVTTLCHGVLIPLGLAVFFLMFKPLVQAYVFSMLSITYIGTAVEHAEERHE